MQQKTALEILKTGKSIFLTGSAGTGKTYLLNQYIEYLKERKIKPSVVAPTGIAASHLDGSTIHSFFGLGIRDFVDDYFLDSLLQKKYLYDRFSKLKILIIDEVSMISPEIFSAMDKILKAFKFTDKPFGGIQIILSGDFFQLPPISKVRKEKRFAWQTPVWKDLELKTCYLEQNFRQGEDKLIKILNDIRSGEISEESYDIFKSRHNRELDINFRPTKLYTHNIDVDRINNEELEKLEEGLKIFEHISSGVKKNIEKIFKSSLLLEEVRLKKNAIVLFIKNNYEKGYINGTTGIVVDFDENDNLPIVEIFSGRRIKVTREDWRMESESGKIIATVSQVPLRLAWAITVHKSQGMTLDAAEIDLSRTFEVGQGYVALSRIKSIEGLKLVGINDMALKVDRLILQIDDSMKDASLRAYDEIKEVTEENKKKQYNAFIEKNGGIIKKEEIKKEKVKLKKEKAEIKEKIKKGEIVIQKEYVIPSWKKTENLIEDSKNLQELSEKRGVALETIFTHLALIKNNNEEFLLEKFKPENDILDMVNEVKESLLEEKNKKNFLENGDLKKKAIFDSLNGEVSYDDIKLSLLFLK